MALSDNIGRLMKARDMTPADLMRATGLSSAQITYLVNGKSTDPHLSTLAKLAGALGCSIDELVNGRPAEHKATPRSATRTLSEGPEHSPAFYGQQKYQDILTMYRGRPVTDLERRLSEGLKSALREKTFDRVSVSEICRISGVSRRSFYRHFYDKYDLLTWTFYQELCVNVEHNDAWVSWDYVPVICSYFEKDRDFYKHACLVRGPNSLREFASARMFPLVKHDFADFGMPQVQVDTFIDRSIGIVYDSIEYWLIEEPDVSAAVFSARFRSKMTQLLQRLLTTIKRPPIS